MLSLFEQQALNDVVSDFKTQVVAAIKTKPIKRISVQYKGGQKTYTEFQAVVNNTGRLAKSVRSEFTDNGIQVLCGSYIDKLIYGQPPGEDVGEFEIFKWMRSKGISDDENVARLINNKIFKEGTSIWIYYKGQDSGLLSDVNIDHSLNKLKQVLTDKYANQVATQIVQSFKIAA